MAMVQNHGTPPKNGPSENLTHRYYLSPLFNSTSLGHCPLSSFWVALGRDVPFFHGGLRNSQWTRWLKISQMSRFRKDDWILLTKLGPLFFRFQPLAFFNSQNSLPQSNQFFGKGTEASEPTIDFSGAKWKFQRGWVADPIEAAILHNPIPSLRGGGLVLSLRSRRS